MWTVRTSMRIPVQTYNEVYRTYGCHYEPLTGVSAKKITDDVLSGEKPEEQLTLLSRYAGELQGKRLLEIGSGFGILTVVARQELGIEAFGVEPGSEGFGGSYELSLEILRENGIDPSVVTKGVGEELPFPDASFDVIYSTNVLEHTADPEKVLREAIRVCRPGGLIQIVVPNYGSFYDGHYASFYLPYQPKWLWKLFLKIFHRKDTSYVDTLRTNINYFSVRHWLKSFLQSGAVGPLTYGKEIFFERMNTESWSAWAGLGKVQRWISFVRCFGLIKVATRILIFIKAWSPLIITLRKR